MAELNPTPPYSRSALLAGAAIIAVVSLSFGPNAIDLSVRILMLGLTASAWNLMAGYGGMFSFGHAAFFGLGVYGSAYVVWAHGLSPWWGLACGVVAAAAFGAVTGLLSFRFKLKGAYFALATFAFAQMLHLLAMSADFLNGSIGIRIPITSGSPWATLQFAPASRNYLLAVLALFVVTMLCIIQFMRSRYGAFLLAVRDDEVAAEATGINVYMLKVAVMALSGGLTALGGGFYAQYVFFADPDVAFGGANNVEILLPAIVGGTGTLWGPLIGAGIVVPLGDVASGLVRNPPAFLSAISGRAGVDLLIYGSALVGAILFMPRGLVGVLKARGSVR